MSSHRAVPACTSSRNRCSVSPFGSIVVESSARRDAPFLEPFERLGDQLEPCAGSSNEKTCDSRPDSSSSRIPAGDSSRTSGPSRSSAARDASSARSPVAWNRERTTSGVLTTINPCWRNLRETAIIGIGSPDVQGYSA